ncbi:MAG: hypothetical protein HYY37_05405 [Candidatus Aenigmarchaeota archaeon]|nr:hypothetical protein [Candidatus Aenigmarchaeota archaeon]
MPASRTIVVEEITVDKVLNTFAHQDGWFWAKYSASPYLGCQYACAYCFLRQDGYGLNVGNERTVGMDDTFSQYLRVKTNAHLVLDKELQDVERDVIGVGDYQPVESTFMLSRKMLEVCRTHEFPVIIIAKSPLVVRDIDVIREISRRSWACVVFSIGSHQSAGYREFFEPFASSVESRFLAMKKCSEAGIHTGTALMPVLPFITDSRENLEAVIRKTKESGGRFVVAGGLALSDAQAESFYKSLERYNKNFVDRYKTLYQGRFSPQDNSWASLGRTVKGLCETHGLDYRIKRFVPDSPLSMNKRLAELLFLRVYEMELNEEPEAEIQKCRELAWRIDEMREPVQCLPDETAVMHEAVEEIMKRVRFGNKEFCIA